MAKKDINSWVPKKNEIFVEPDGKLFICHFYKKFNHKEKLDVYERFLIGKPSYINQLDNICKYINYFMNKYDKDDELISGYLKIKFELDNQKSYNAENMDAYIEFLYQILFTDTMIDKIISLTKDNYTDDIEVGSDSKKRYNNSQKYMESLEFKNIHVKILLAISFGMKILSPVMLHYCQINQIRVTKDSDIIFKFYRNLFKIFSYGDTWELCDENEHVIEKEISDEDGCKIIKKKKIEPTVVGYHKYYYFTDDDGKLMFYRRTPINVYNKLYVYVYAKVLDSNSNNAPIFAQREIFGVDICTVIHLLTRKDLISENMVKYKFNENIVGFNKTVIKYQLVYFLKDQYEKNLSEVTNTKNSDGLSGSDKLIMNQNKVDEGSITMSDLNIEMTLEKVKEEIDLPITDEEIDYYVKNHQPSSIQTCLVYAYYTKYFGNFRDLNLLTKRHYVTLMLLLKKKLILDLGFESDNQMHEVYLPYILSGNLSDKINNRIIRNSKYISKIRGNYMYNDLINKKYKLLESMKPEFIIGLLSKIINTKFTYVLYEQQDLTGKEIVYSEDKISDELLYLLNII